MKTVKVSNLSLAHLKSLYPTIPSEYLAHWHNFVQAKPAMRKVHESYQTSYHIGDSVDSSERGLELIKTGKKTATSELLSYFHLNSEECPVVGKICIISSLKSDSICIVQTTDVSIISFDSITEEFVEAYGETISTTKSWYEAFTPYYEKHSSLLGQKLTSDTLLVIETFKLLFYSNQ